MTPIRTTLDDEPVLEPGSPTFVAECDAIAAAIVPPSDGNDAHWVDSARTLIAAMLIHNATHFHE